MTPAELQAYYVQKGQEQSGGVNRFGRTEAAPIQIPYNQDEIYKNAGPAMRQAMRPVSGVPFGPPYGHVLGSPDSPPPNPGTPPSGGPGASYNPPWASSLPAGAFVNVDQYYSGLSPTRPPKGKPSAQDVQNFFMVNMGRKATPYEVSYYTGGKRWDQLIRDTGQNRGAVSLTGYTEGNPQTPLGPEYFDWRQALAGQA